MLRTLRRGIFELRTYRVQAGKFNDFMSLTASHIGERTKVSPLTGYFASETGGLLNCVHSLWEYESLDHRAEVRAAMLSNPKWTKEYLGVMRPWLESQESLILNHFPWSKPEKRAEGKNLYELRNYRLKAGHVPAWEAIFKKGLPERAKFSSPSHVFFTEFGGLNRVVHIWPYRDFAHRGKVRVDALTNPVWKETVVETVKLMEEQNSTIIYPTPWSPMQ